MTNMDVWQSVVSQEHITAGEFKANECGRQSYRASLRVRRGSR